MSYRARANSGRALRHDKNELFRTDSMASGMGWNTILHPAAIPYMSIWGSASRRNWAVWRMCSVTVLGRALPLARIP
jgi:hypothetical protein